MRWHCMRMMSHMRSGGRAAPRRLAPGGHPPLDVLVVRLAEVPARGPRTTSPVKLVKRAPDKPLARRGHCHWAGLLFLPGFVLIVM
jgi:hypothetical protein